MPMAQRRSRPTGVSTLAFLEILFGAVGLAASSVIIALSPLVSSLPRIGPLVASLGLGIGGGLVLFSIVWLATGVGFLKGKGWSWNLGMIFSVISIFGAIGALAVGLISGGIGAIVFWTVMIYYLTRIRVKTYFGKAAFRANPSAPTLENHPD